VAAIVGATAGAIMVFSLLGRPVAEESVAARTLVKPDASWPVTAGTSVAAQQPTEPRQIKSPAETTNDPSESFDPRSRAGSASAHNMVFIHEKGAVERELAPFDIDERSLAEGSRWRLGARRSDRLDLL
jgi:hypothetical protein